MQEAVVADVTGAFLESSTADSERFVYSNYVMPLLITAGDEVTPLLPGYKRTAITEFVDAGIIDASQLSELLSTLDLGEVLSFNELNVLPRPVDPNPADRLPEVGTTIALENIDEANELLRMIDSSLSESGRVVAYAARAKLDEARASIAGGLSGLREPLLPEPPPPPTQEQMIEFFIGLLQSDIAYFFLDRTRIRPSGFRIGEQVYALSLGPGEEVTLEQKTFSKRQVTFEEQNDQEAEFNIELASTLSTEIQEGYERQKTITDTWGLNVGKTGSYSSPVISDVAYGSFNTNHTIGYTKNVTAADQETRRRSTKDGQVASSKVAAKYRTAHKTVFRVAAEHGFESVAKRTIRNPNRFTPVTLHFFKILQRLELDHERYGVRLGWTPCIKDPAYSFFAQITAGKAKILSDAEAALPAKPAPPIIGGGGDGGGTTAPTDKWFSSEIVLAGRGAADGSMSGDFTVDVPFGADYEWDGNLDRIVVDKLGARPKENFSADRKGVPVVVKDPSSDGSALRVVVHIGAQADVRWGGPRMIEFQVQVRMAPKVDDTPPAADPAAAEALAAYNVAVRDWEATCEEQRAAARRAADNWEQTMRRNVNPVVEMVSQIIKRSFPAMVRDEGWEIDLWQKLFDWERANYVAYPSWWSDAPMRDPTLDPSEFVNASWARLYLPVRVGMERLALRWMHAQTTRKLRPAVEAQFDAIEADLKAYRNERFGDEMETMSTDADGVFQEQFDTLATWTDLMPTDGTHIEVVQAFSMAADELTLRESEEASKLRQAVLAGHQDDAKLKSKAIDQMSEPASVDVTIAPFGTLDGSS
jgi:hypothetical protein